MRGGIHLHRGGASAARAYVECGLTRSDDYYLRETPDVARRFGVDANGRVVELAAMNGDAYEAWVLGADPGTGEPRGRLRQDEHAVRFGDFTVNGPKSWSLAAELHADIAAAYDAAQQRAAVQVIGWLGEHLTVRVGPRGAQVPVPVERLEAAVVKHYTSRAGDPHRHLHVQVNARAYALGKWRGLDTVALLDSVQAMNGIGHAAMTCDPEFRATLAAHGYSLNSVGEIEQLTDFVGPFSKRAAQIGANIDRYETEWRHEHPGAEPGPELVRAWDRRAWAEQRPDKNPFETAETARRRWLDELRELELVKIVV